MKFKVKVNRKASPTIIVEGFPKQAEETASGERLLSALEEFSLAVHEVFHEGIVEGNIENGITLDIEGDESPNVRAEIIFKVT